MKYCNLVRKIHQPPFDTDQVDTRGRACDWYAQPGVCATDGEFYTPSLKTQRCWWFGRKLVLVVDGFLESVLVSIYMSIRNDIK